MKSVLKTMIIDEIKLHGSQDDIHEEIYHWYAPYYGTVKKIVGLRDQLTDMV